MHLGAPRPTDRRSLQSFSRSLAAAALAAVGLVGTLSAQNVIQVTLTPGQEVPPVVSTGTGTGTVTVNTDTNLVSVSGTYSNLIGNATLAHIHQGVIGMNGGVQLNLAVTGGKNGTFSGSGVMSAAQVNTLLLGGMYLNVHTSSFGGGELRGQITAVPAATSYGNSINPPGSLVVLSGTPKINTTFTVGVHNPAGSQAPGGPTFLFAANAQGSLPLPGFGMAGPLGEVVISIAPPNPVLTIAGGAWTGVPAPYPLALPNNAKLVGKSINLQGLIVDPFTLGIGLTEGMLVYMGI